MAQSWDALERCLLKELKPAHKNLLVSQAINDFQKLEARLNTLRIERHFLGIEMRWNKLNKVISLVKPVAHAADILARGSCLPSTAIWGALGLIIDCVGSQVQIFDTVIHAYEDLFSVLPRVADFAPALDKSPNLKSAVADVYSAFTSITMKIMKVIGGDLKLPCLISLRWMRDRKLLQNAIYKIDSLVQKARIESNIAFEEHRHAENTQMMRQTLESTQAILETINTSQSLPKKSENTKDEIFVAPKRNPSFSGRESIITEIKDRLIPTDTSDESQTQHFVVICGLGGMGKSQLALEYAHQNKSYYKTCFWITCDSAVKIAEDFAQIAQHLGYDDAGVVQNQSRVNSWLLKTDQKWLLILDNAESPSEVSFWPQTNNGSIILTTQDSNWLLQEYTTLHIKLEPLFLDEAKGLVTEIFDKHQRPISQSEAREIFEITRGLPLAIRQITSYIIAENLNIEEFLKDYIAQKNAKVIHEWKHSATSFYSFTLATFLNISFAKLQDRALLILRILCILDVDKIQESVLYLEGEAVDNESPFGNLSRHDKDLSDLYRYSLISKNREESYITVHRQVKQNVLGSLTKPELEQAVSWVIYRLRLLFPRQSPFSGELDDSFPNCALCINHLLELRKAIHISNGYDIVRETQDLASLYLDGGIYLWAKGFLVDGGALTSEAKKVCDIASVDKPMMAQIYSFHASILSDSGEVELALEYFEKSLEILKLHMRNIRDTAQESDEALFANAWNNLAGIYCAIEDYDKAEMYNKISIKQKEKLAKCFHDDKKMAHLFCLSNENMAATYARQMRYEEAEDYFEKAITQATLANSTSRLALIHHNFGIMRLMQDQIHEATKLFNEASNLRFQKLGKYPDTATSLHMLASCYCKLGGFGDLILARLVIKGNNE
ncbi:hypothetical protein V8C34DRAFT_280884 [Trichoderma compactum]